MEDLLEYNIDKDRRGIVGIGTMIVFIAMIIVASVAAGVLINTAGSLQQQARATGQETISEVSSGVKVLAAKGKTASEGKVENVDIIVRCYAGSKGINLENTIIQYESQNEVKHLSYSSEDNFSAASAANNFIITKLQDVSDTGKSMLETMGDIAKISIQPGTNLGPSDTASVTFYPNSGFKTSYGITVPPTTQSNTWYEL